MGAPVVFCESTSHDPRLDDLQTFHAHTVVIGSKAIGLPT
jgi:hypothetical protein